MISILLLILLVALRLYLLLLWGRFALEWLRVLAPQFRPKKLLLVVFEVVYTLTDPPVKLVRKIVPPVRIGPVMLDMALMVSMLLVWLAMQFVNTALWAL